MSRTQVKGILSDFVAMIARLFNIRVSDDSVKQHIVKAYDTGLEEMELEFNLNFTRDDKKLEMLQDFTLGVIKDLNDEQVTKLKKVIERSVIEQRPLGEVTKDVQSIIDDTKERAKMIARTEKNRAQNFGRLNAAMQSDLNVRKWAMVQEDERTSGICKAIHDKYGSEEQAIALDANFTVTVDGKVISQLAPPFHPNCRTRLMTVQK